jgi:diaminopimelate epimerase
LLLIQKILQDFMEVAFYKYQGTGNDFVMIDDRSSSFSSSQEVIAHLCDRRFGIGADGLILLRKEDGYDFRMIYFNADGAEGSMCGNGGRCTVRFAHDLGLFDENTTFLAVDGLHEATATSEVINLKMGNVTGVKQLDGHDFMNTGSPHYVTFVEDLKGTDVVGLGRAIRYGEVYGPKGGTNVNFVEVVGENQIKVRTYERGVEDETYSCGTGVTACALSANRHFGWTGPVEIETLGGNLTVSFEPDGDGYKNIYLCGPAVHVFQGNVIV